MNTTLLRVAGLCVVLSLVGCDTASPPRVNLAPKPTSSQPTDVQLPDADEPPDRPYVHEVEKETVGNRKRLKVKAEVCLRERGQIGLECLLCLARFKEHESVLKTWVHPEAILDGLKAIGATPGSPPKYVWLETAPKGEAKVALRYERDGKAETIPTQWVVPPDQGFQFYAEYVKDGKPQPVPVTGEVPGGTRVTAWLAFNIDGKFEELPKVSFDAPAGRPIKLGLELTQSGKVTVIPALYRPATGTPIRVTLQYEQNGKLITVPAGQWLRNGKTGKDLDLDFVLAGSVWVQQLGNPNGAPVLAANHAGGLICVCDVPDALMALPVWSPKGRDDRFYDPATDRIPPVGHPVTVILEPLPDGK